MSLVSCTERVATTAVSVPISVDGLIPTRKGKEAARRCRAVVDQYQQVELVVTQVLADESGQGTTTITTLERGNAYQGQG